MKNPEKIVSLSFRIYEKLAADLKIRLRYDNVSQSAFMRGLANLYLESDPDMLTVISKIKQREKSMGKTKLKQVKKDYDKSRNLLEKLGISESDKKDIFDIIEMDTKEYE